ncbi:MAG: DNA polymerase III subunit gamma/tau [Deltaproteobacteria bacterium]|nr:DNA polymerase III subunit gamma/tau [Deltaproteobacteria bacterium]
MSAYLVLARKYRPTTFSEVVGQDHVITTLKNSVLSGRVAHAFLFCGVRGVGKTTVARILAKSLNCTGRPSEDADPCCVCSSCREISGGYSIDVQEIDGASHTSVDNIREINENIKYPPVTSNYKIIIIDEVHMISMNAFNALLKTLEEPPAHAKFIFATTESHKVPATINSRCQRFNFRTIPVRDISVGMAGILTKEGIEASTDALDVIAREAQGSFRDALSLLDQVVAFGAGRIDLDTVQGILGIGARDRFFSLLEAIINHDPSVALDVLRQVFNEGYDPEQFILDLIRFLRNLILVAHSRDNAPLINMIDASESEIQLLRNITQQTSYEELNNLFSILLKSEGEIKRSGIPLIALEMTIVKMCMAPCLVDLSSLLKKMDSPAARPKTAIPDGFRQTFSTPPQTGFPETPKPKPLAVTEEPIPPVPAKPSATKSDDQRFTITDITPVPTGSPDEVWENFRNTIKLRGLDGLILSMLDHGSLISYGPNELEIGFTKSFYKEQFESYLKTKPELAAIIEDIFGPVQTRVLVLSKKTSLVAEKPFSETLDGQSDLHRAMRKEAMENALVRTTLKEFENSSIEEIRIITHNT